MLLTVDIGNTNISFGVFEGKKLSKRFDIPTQGYSLRLLKKSLGRIEMEDCIICSVVPNVSRILKADLKNLLGKRPCVVGEGVKVPIKNLYRKPRQVGSDRLVNAYAGTVLYGAPLIIVDFGTAVTFDAISRRREYLGGMILPGARISLDVLTERTALLPKIKLNKPAELIGRDTKSSMLSGIVYGFASLAENLTKRIKEKIGKDAKVVATGGDVGIIGRYSGGIDKIDKNLTLKGLMLVITAKGKNKKIPLDKK